MASVSTAMAKNVIRRAFSQLVDPSPDKLATEQIWAHFESRCAYCGRQVTLGVKEGHIDHLESASVGGRNHLPNRVLACAPCNEKEKRDMHWEDFLRIKSTSEEEFAERHGRIMSWQQLNAVNSTIAGNALIAAAAAAAEDVTTLLDSKVKELKALKRRFEAQDSEPAPPVREPRDPPKADPVYPQTPLTVEAPRPKSNASVVYGASRFAFKADLIEPLAENQIFRIETPEGNFEMTKAEFYRDFLSVTQTKSYKRDRLYHFPTVPERARRYKVFSATSDADFTLDQVVDALGKAERRATYGLVGRITGKPATFLMQGRERDARHIWIVNQQTGLPTGYNLSAGEEAKLLAKPTITQMEVLKDLLERFVHPKA
jgi:hypothetical protein